MSIATGKWVLEKASLHMYQARIAVSVNQNGEVGGKCEWKMAMVGGEQLTQFWIQNIISPPPHDSLLRPCCLLVARASLSRLVNRAMLSRQSSINLTARATRQNSRRPERQNARMAERQIKYSSTRLCILMSNTIVMALPSRLALCTHGLCFALAARATCSRLGLHPRGKCYALAVCATR